MSDDGGPAFPVPMDSADRKTYHMGANGLSLRDYFAAAALTGQLHNDAFSVHDFVAPTIMAKRAYMYADAMLKAREVAKRQGTREENVEGKST